MKKNKNNEKWHAVVTLSKKNFFCIEVGRKLVKRSKEMFLRIGELHTGSVLSFMFKPLNQCIRSSDISLVQGNVYWFNSYSKLFFHFTQTLLGVFCINVPEIYTNTHCNSFINCTVNRANISFSISLGFVTNANICFCFML